MQIAHARLKIDSSGADIPLKYVTPAEVMALRAGHGPVINGEPVTQVYVVGDADRSDKTELSRLTEKYKKLLISSKGQMVSVVESLFPGVNPSLPQTFKEAGISVLPEPPIIPPPPDDAPDGDEDIVLNEAATSMEASERARQQKTFRQVITGKI
jgi:hypothetical protein